MKIRSESPNLLRNERRKVRPVGDTPPASRRTAASRRAAAPASVSSMSGRVEPPQPVATASASTAARIGRSGPGGEVAVLVEAGHGRAGQVELIGGGDADAGRDRLDDLRARPGRAATDL